MGTVFLLILVLLSSFALAGGEAGSIVASPVNGPAPLVVDFTFRSSINVGTYSWDFDSDGQVDATNQDPSYTFPVAGQYLVTLTIVDASGLSSTFTKSIQVTSSMAVSLTATPQSGVAPLAVQFNSIATGNDPITYGWDFNGDGAIDSTQQNPLKTFDNAGEYNVTLKVSDGSGSMATKVIPISVTTFDSHLVLTSYFPTSLNAGENQITLLLSNNGTETLRDLSAKVVGDGLQHLTSTELSVLKPGEEDSLTVKVNVLKGGSLAGTIKVMDKKFPVSFTVAGQVTYTLEELNAELNTLKKNIQDQEKMYNDKKAEGYLVSEVYDSIKSIKNNLQLAQESILTKKYAEAKVNLDLAASGIADVTNSLENVQQQKQTFLQWMKENAVAITAIIAALGTLSGFLIKMAGHAKKVGQQAKQAGEGALHKVGETVKKKISKKSGESAETKKESKKEEKKDAKAKEEKFEKQDTEESFEEESK